MLASDEVLGHDFSNVWNSVIVKKVRCCRDKSKQLSRKVPQTSPIVCEDWRFLMQDRFLFFTTPLKNIVIPSYNCVRDK